MADEEKKQETPAEFLKRVGASLDKGDGADKDLAKILSTHVLVVPAGAEAVAKAKAAIIALAEKRAKPVEAGGG